MITNQEIVEDIAVQFGDKTSEFEEPKGMLTFTCEKDSIIDILRYFNESDRLRFRFLTDITAFHNPDNSGKEFCVVYHIHSFENGSRVRIKVFLPQNNLDIPTATSLYAAANWMERETFDFYGVNFVGHPNLKRILNMDEMDYFPMRKEYPLEDATREDKIDALFGR